MKYKNFFKYFSLTVISFLISCNSENNNEEEHVVEKVKGDTLISLTYEKLPFTKDFSGKVYSFIEHPETMECDQINGGDCNGFSVLFLDKENYIILIYCLYRQWITQGKYKAEDNKIFFTTDSLSISLEKNDYNLMVDSWDCIDKTYSKVVKDSAIQFQCKDKMYFKLKDNYNTYYGFHDKEKTLEFEIQQLKKDSVWYKLLKSKSALLKFNKHFFIPSSQQINQ